MSLYNACNATAGELTGAPGRPNARLALDDDEGYRQTMGRRKTTDLDVYAMFESLGLECSRGCSRAARSLQRETQGLIQRVSDVDRCDALAPSDEFRAQFYDF